MTIDGIEDFNDKCRLVIMEHMGSLSLCQHREFSMLSKKFSMTDYKRQVTPALIRKGFIANKYDGDPMRDEEPGDWYATSKGIEALSSGELESEAKDERYRNLARTLKWAWREIVIAFKTFNIIRYI